MAEVCVGLQLSVAIWGGGVLMGAGLWGWLLRVGIFSFLQVGSDGSWWCWGFGS